MKRWFALLLAVCLLLGGIPYRAQAAQVASGSCGEASWQMDSDGTLHINGSGRMLYHGGWDSSAIHKVVIGEGVTTVCMDAFRDATNLTTVVIAGTVRSIGFHSFDGCTGLTQVWLPDSVVVVGEYAFNNCTSLKDVRMGDRIVMIGEYAFANCPIQVLDLPDELLHLGSFAFIGGKMDTVVIPDTITGFNWGTFQDCENLKNLHIPEGVKNSHLNVFQGCKALEMVVVPASMGSISTMFDRRDNLRTLVYMGDFLGEPFEDYTTEDHGRAYTLWYPADNPTWTREARDSLDGVITWRPYVKGEDGTLTTVVTTEAQVQQALEELMQQYPEGSDDHPWWDSYILGANKEFVDSVTDTLFADQQICGGGPVQIDQLRVGDVILRKYKSGIYESIDGYFLVTGVQDDHVTVGYVVESKHVSRDDYITWQGILTRAELENGSGEVTYTYTTRYSQPQTLELPVIEEPQVDESLFPQEIKTYSVPKILRPSKFGTTGGYINPFTDVKSDRFENAILWAYYNGITTGTTATTFSPESTCTRKQIVTFLWRYFGSPEPGDVANPFTDVPQDRFYKAIMWAYEKGITKGTTDTTFGPEEPCTRKQIVTFLWRAAGKLQPLESGNPFTDVPANQFTNAILWAYYRGITTGTTATTFSPEAPCTRKQIVTFLWRFAGEPDYSVGQNTALGGPVLPVYFAGRTSDIYLVEGQSCQMYFYNEEEDLNKLEVSSNDEELVSVSPEGVVTALKPGEANIWVRYNGRGTGVGITILSKESAASQISITNSGGAFYDGMTLYLGDELDVTFRADGDSGCCGVSVINSNKSVVDAELVNDYSFGGTVTLSAVSPGDTVITVFSPDGAVKHTYRIHVEEYHSFDPGHGELLSPEEFACYATLAAADCGFRYMDEGGGGWREGSPLKASELTYDRAIAWGMASDHYWETSRYYDNGAVPVKTYNYVGDREWNGEICYRIQDGF